MPVVIYVLWAACTDNTGFGYWHSDANDGFIKLSFRFKKKWAAIFMSKMFCFNEKKKIVAYNLQ